MSHMGDAKLLYYDQQTRRLHRQRFRRKVWYRLRWPVMRVICILDEHSFWARESMLVTLGTRRSKRCKWCNRLIIKRQYQIQR